MEAGSDISHTGGNRRKGGYKVQIIDGNQQGADKNDRDIGQDEVRDFDDNLGRQFCVVERDRHDPVRMQAQRKTPADQLQTDQNADAFDTAGGRRGTASKKEQTQEDHLRKGRPKVVVRGHIAGRRYDGNNLKRAVQQRTKRILKV